MKIRAICYHQYEPTVYNKGTKYERTCSDFLATPFCGTIEEALNYADKLNHEKPEKLFTGDLALCDERFYFADEIDI